MPIDVFESYLGGWRPDLLTFYKEKLEKPSKSKMSFTAVFLGITYYGYSRIGYQGFIMLLILVCIDYILESAYALEIPIFAYGMTYGIVYNDFIIHRARGIYKKLKAKSLSDEQIIQAISGEGKPSLIEGAVCTLVFVAFFALETLALESI